MTRRISGFFVAFHLFFPHIIFDMTKNKYIILLMSCNQKAYLDEEKACMDTFLKDADSEGVPYYFYRGSDVSGTVVDGHLILVPAPDGLSGTYPRGWT